MSLRPLSTRCSWTIILQSIITYLSRRYQTIVGLATRTSRPSEASSKRPSRNKFPNLVSIHRNPAPHLHIRFQKPRYPVRRLPTCPTSCDLSDAARDARPHWRTKVLPRRLLRPLCTLTRPGVLCDIFQSSPPVKEGCRIRII